MAEKSKQTSIRVVWLKLTLSSYTFVKWNKEKGIKIQENRQGIIFFIFYILPSLSGSGPSGWSLVFLGEYSTRANSGLHEGLLAGKETANIYIKLDP